MSSPHFFCLKEDLTSHGLPDMHDNMICCQLSPVAHLMHLFVLHLFVFVCLVLILLVYFFVLICFCLFEFILFLLGAILISWFGVWLYALECGCMVSR